MIQGIDIAYFHSNFFLLTAPLCIAFAIWAAKRSGGGR